MADITEQDYDRFRFTEVYRPMFAKMILGDANTCIMVIKAFSNASHFSIDTWRLPVDTRYNKSDRLIMHSSDADALVKVLELDSYQIGKHLFYLDIAAPKYLCDRVLTELDLGDQIDVEKQIVLETADFSGQRTVGKEKSAADKSKS